MDAVSVTDFPIRGHKVVLNIRCKRWIDARICKSFSIQTFHDIVVEGDCIFGC